MATVRFGTALPGSMNDPVHEDGEPDRSAPAETRKTYGGEQWRGVELLCNLIVAATFVWCFVRAFHFAWYSMFSTFFEYDDEGYVLLSVREFLLGRALYDEVFTQYGPAYYAYKHILSLFQGLPTHDITRWTTLYVWMSSCSALSLAAWWLTRSSLAATAVFCAMSIALQALRHEPGHPHELLIALTALSIAIAASPLRTVTRAALLITIATVACLTKINVGIFIGLAALGALLPLGPGAIRVALALALAAMPLALMSRHLSAWAWPYALASSAGILTGVAMAPDLHVRISSFRKSAPMIAALLLPITAVGLYLMARHSTWTAIANGVLVRPILLADIFVIPFQVPPGSLALSLAVAGLALSTAQRDSAVHAWLQPALPGLKIGAGLYVIFRLGTNWAEIVSYGAILIFALLAGARAMEPRAWFGRAFLALSAAFHACTAYPVAGSQMWWSTYLLIMAGLVCIWDGSSRLRAAVADSPALNRIAATALMCLALTIYFATLTPLESMAAAYESQVPLPFEGSRSIRVTPAQAASYDWLVANLQGHCSTFVSLPGYNSLHLWSGVRPATGFNAGAWMLLLNDEEQIETADRLRHAPRPCAVYSQASVGGWTSRSVSDRPLVAYVLGLAPVASRGGYELRIPAGAANTWGFEYLLAGRRLFDSNERYPVPAEVLTAASDASLRLWFRSRAGGTIVGLQSVQPPLEPSSWCPVLYLGQDGRLRAELWTGAVAPITSAGRVDDGEWHHAVLVTRADRQRLFLDGALVGEAGGAVTADWATTLQIGTGYTRYWPEGNGSWFPFSGEIRDAIVSPKPWDSDAVVRDYAQSSDGEASR